MLLLKRSITSLGKIQLQDPAFTESERKFLSSLELEVLLENVEGRFSTEADQRVLYYLPHCPKSLTNNVLETNWSADKLHDSILVCNSFQALLINSLERDIIAEAKYVKRISEFATETELKVSEKFFDAFNDTSIHLFEEQDLAKIIDPTFWVVDQLEQSKDLELIQALQSVTIN